MPLELLLKIQSSRKLLAENFDSPYFLDMVKDTVIRFSISSGKYILGIIDSVVDANSPCLVSFQKNVGFDKEKQQPVVKNMQIKCDKDLIVSLGNTGIFKGNRKVKISFVSNTPFMEDEIIRFRKNFGSTGIPLSKE